MNVPADLLYAKSHEWLRVDGEVATIGITDFAQEELGDIVYLELPDEGEQVERESPFGVIESIKAVADLISGVTGTVVAVNARLLEDPQHVNQDPYGEGWLLKVRLADSGELQLLLTGAQYSEWLEEA